MSWSCSEPNRTRATLAQGLRYQNEGAHPAPSSGSTPDASVSSTAVSGASETPGLASTWTLPYMGDAPTQTQRLLHGVLSVGVQWGFARLRRHGLVHGWSGAESVRKMCQRLLRFVSIAAELHHFALTAPVMAGRVMVVLREYWAPKMVCHSAVLSGN